MEGSGLEIVKARGVTLRDKLEGFCDDLPQNPPTTLL